MNEEEDMDRGKQRKEFIKNPGLSKKEVSSNWLNFLKENGKSFRNSLKLEPAKEPKETKTPSSTFREKKETSSLLQDHSDLEKRKKKNFKFGKGSGKSKEPLVTKVLAIDCEMVSDINDRNMLARVSIVNYKLQCLYDKYVQPTLPVGDYRTSVSGIRESNLKNGTDFYVVNKEVRELIRNKILVGHALGNDFKVLKLRHNKKLIRDTSKYEKFYEIGDGRSPSLKKLAKSLLGETIQEGEHNSVEDATTAMKLYIKYRHEWEATFLTKHDPETDKNLVLNVKED